MSKAMFDYMPQIVWTSDKNGRVNYLNKFWNTYTGWPEGKATNEWADAVHPDEKSTAVKVWETAVKNGVHYEQEIRMKRPDGSYGWILARAVPIDGDSDEWLGFGVDITEKKNIEMKLRETQKELLQERALLEAVLLQLPVGVIVTDTSGNFLLQNQKLKEMTKSSTNYTTIFDYVKFGMYKENGKRCTEDDYPICKCIKKQEMTINEYFHLIVKTGENLLLRINTRPVYNPEGKMIAVVSISEDVTKNKQLEREALELKSREKVAVEASKLKSQFLANMSHEIRTPLNGILGMAQILAQDKTLNDEQLQFANIIKNSGKLLLSIINDILDFSKIEAGKLEIEHIPFSLEEAFQLCIDLMAPISQDKNIPIITQLVNFPKVYGDPSRFQQILCNLLSNALKFTKQGEVIISTSGTYEHDKYQLKMRIKDTGIGMDEDMKNRLFKPFTQKDSSTSRQYGGSGLGLSISKKLIELMDGTISVESEPFVGTEFICNFTFDVVSDSIESKKIEEKHPEFDIGNLKILMAEDNKINQVVAKKLLERTGFQKVHIVNDGKDAVEECMRNNYDLVLMDLHMPEMDGFEATRKIREFDKNIPIIAMTASATQRDKEECEKAEMDGHISKPISIEVLRKSIFSVYCEKKFRH